MIDFPLYVMREYVCINTEAQYKIITTYKTKYVLDYATASEKSYSLRRVALLGEKLPYKLYPLSKRITSLTEMFTCNNRVFIDNKGVIRRYTPSDYQNLVCRAIEYREVLKDGNMLIKVIGIPHTINTPYSTNPYARVVKYKGVYVLYDFCDRKLPNKRKKL